MTPGDFVSRLTKVRRHGTNKWMACCPAHDDKSPSLAISATPQGKILLKCFAGCEALDIVHSMGLELTDLFPDDYQEHPMGFAQREMASRRHAKSDQEKAILWLQIITAKLRNGDRVSHSEIEKAKVIKQKLRLAGVV